MFVDHDLTGEPIALILLELNFRVGTQASTRVFFWLHWMVKLMPSHSHTHVSFQLSCSLGTALGLINLFRTTSLKNSHVLSFKKNCQICFHLFSGCYSS